MNKSNTIEDTIQETKSAFADYFAMVGGKKFKQFYYDWHVDNMMAPFAGLVEYFQENYGDNAEQKFHQFVQDIDLGIDGYNADKPQLSDLTIENYSKTKDGRFASLVAGIETFGFEFRQFIYSFASKKDHAAEFGNWPVKTNMPYSCQHGLLVGRNILHYLDAHFSKIVQEGDIYQRALYAADAHLRKNIVKDYKYRQGYSFADRKRAIKKLHELRNKLANKAQNDATSQWNIENQTNKLLAFYKEISCK